MDRTRILRRPIVWIVLVVLAALVLTTFFTNGDDYKKVSTSIALSQVTSGNVVSATIEDREQVLQLNLKNPVDGSTKVEASYPAEATSAIFATIWPNGKAGAKGVAFDTKVTKDSFWASLLISLLRSRGAAASGVLLHEPDAGRRQPGHELRQVQGQAGQQGHPEDHVRGRGRR